MAEEDRGTDGPNRREALKLGAAGFLALAPFGGAFAVTPESAGLPWANQAMRWMQVAFTEDNPRDCDPKVWFDFFRKTHSDVVCLSAGGSIAFYPSKVPLHHRAKYLGNRDLFGEMVRGSRALGMSIIARVDPHALSEEAFAVHPDWAACTEDGKPRRHWAAKDMYVTCQNGGFMFDFMPKVLKEIADSYTPEAFFGNRWAGSGMCWCNVCRTKFRAATGLELPTSFDPQDPRRHAYIAWDAQMRWQQYTLWNDTVRASKPDCFFSPNGGMNDPAKVTIPMIAADRQGRSGLTPVWANGKYAKTARATMGHLPVAGLFNIGVEDENRWKDSVQADAEIEAWVRGGIAQGFRPWMCKFDAQIIDPRWMPVVEKIYAWHFAHDRYLRNTGNLARVALVNSRQSGTFYGGGGANGHNARVADAQNGYYQALVEARIPFEIADDRLLDAPHLVPYRVLVLPNIAALSDRQCGQLRDYVMGGGRIVATGETSLYDEGGRRRTNFGLADLFGCDFTGVIDDPVHNSYLTPRHPHPLTRGLEDAPRIIGPVQQLHVTARDNTLQPLTLVSSYPDLPMERVYTLTPETNIPMVFCRNVGKGRVVYFPNDMDRTFWEVLAPDHRLVLGNAVEWAADEPAPLHVAGTGLLDIAYWRQKNSLAVHLVNMNNPMMMKGPYREIAPLAGPFTVTMVLPARAKIAGVKLLESGVTPASRRSDDRLVVEVPRISLHEIIAVDLV